MPGEFAASFRDISYDVKYLVWTLSILGDEWLGSRREGVEEVNKFGDACRVSGAGVEYSLGTSLVAG
jgi:hypothetical protein